MSFLVAAVALALSLTLLNLLLTYGVIRRLRQHTELISSSQSGSGRQADDDAMAAIGSTVGDFTATADDGTAVTPALFGRASMVGFFAPGCPPCAELLPTFIKAAGSAADRPLAVVAEGADDQAYRDQLAPVALVISGAEGHKIASAFQVIAFPSICTVDEDGVITARGNDLLTRPQPVAA